MSTEILQADRIVKTFGLTKALQSVYLTLNAGEIRGLIGENGSIAHGNAPPLRQAQEAVHDAAALPAHANMPDGDAVAGRVGAKDGGRNDGGKHQHRERGALEKGTAGARWRVHVI